MGTDLPITIGWTNFGTAPAYENWEIFYEIFDQAGESVLGVKSGLSLGTIAAEQHYPIRRGIQPAPPATTPSYCRPADLSPGITRWWPKSYGANIKPDGFNRVDYPTMGLPRPDATASAAIQSRSFGSATEVAERGPKGEPAAHHGAEPKVVSAQRLPRRKAMSSLSTRVGGLANHRRLCGPDHGQQQFRVDLTGTQVGVPVGARACGIARIVAVHKVYATGDGDNAVDSIDECLPPPRYGRCPSRNRYRSRRCDPTTARWCRSTRPSYDCPGGVLQIDRHIGVSAWSAFTQRSNPASTSLSSA